MKRVSLIVLTLLVSVAGPAGAQISPTDGNLVSTTSPVRPVGGSLAAEEPGETLRLAAQATGGVQPPRDASTPRRRGSMVGYIDDPVVSSKVRVRFDIGRHNNVPDRAEFFYGKCGCYRGLSRTDAAFDPAASGPGPGIVSDLNFRQWYVQGEYAATERFSIFAELPSRSIQPQSFVPGTGSFGNQSGIGDVRAGVKLALSDVPDQMLTAQVKMSFPTGDALRGLGTDHASVEPAFLYYQQVSDRVSVESQLGVWIPIGGSAPVPTAADGHFAGNVFFYGIGPSFDVFQTANVRFAPVIELVGWRVLSGNQTGGPSDASGTNIVNLKIGARTSWGRGASIYVGYGHALTDAVWYDDIVRFEYRFSF
jgi:hypothetical protein